MNYEAIKVNSPENLIERLKSLPVSVQTIGVVGWHGQGVIAIVGYEGNATPVVSDKQPAHQAVIWLAGRVFTDRNFAERLDKEGLNAVMKECPVDDLTSNERKTFQACLKNAKLRAVADEWWATYDEERDSGDIPSVKAPWY